MLVGSMTPIPSLHTNRPLNSLCKKLEDLDIKAIHSGNVAQLNSNDIKLMLKTTQEQIIEQEKTPPSGYFVLLPVSCICFKTRYAERI